MEYTEEDAKFDRLLDEMEAKMNLDCPDSFQLRGIKEEDLEEEEEFWEPEPREDFGYFGEMGMMED